MALSKPLERNVRPKRQLDAEDDDESETTLEEDDDMSGGTDRSADEDDPDIESGGDSDKSDDQVQEHIRNVSFGALQKAQQVLLSKKRKRDENLMTTSKDEKLEALRARLRQIKEDKTKNAYEKPAKVGSKHISTAFPSTADSQAGNADRDTNDSDSDTDSAPSEEGASTSRTSKHAPMSQTTRHQVTRKRSVISVPKRTSRDPRFDALSQRPTHAGATDKAYSFLRTYQESEIRDLGAAIQVSRNEEEKDALRRQMMGMQNRLRAKDAQQREQEVLRGHRKEEKERVLQDGVLTTIDDWQECSDLSDCTNETYRKEDYN
nr:rrna biogenesis protein rrp36 [Quercus suber]